MRRVKETGPRHVMKYSCIVALPCPETVSAYVRAKRALLKLAKDNIKSAKTLPSPDRTKRFLRAENVVIQAALKLADEVCR